MRFAVGAETRSARPPSGARRSGCGRSRPLGGAPVGDWTGWSRGRPVGAEPVRPEAEARPHRAIRADGVEDDKPDVRRVFAARELEARVALRGDDVPRRVGRSGDDPRHRVDLEDALREVVYVKFPSRTTYDRAIRRFQNSTSHHWMALTPHAVEIGNATIAASASSGTTASTQSRTTSGGPASGRPVRLVPPRTLSTSLRRTSVEKHSTARRRGAQAGAAGR